MANRNFPNSGKDYSFHVAPVTITCNFVVDEANGNGTGIRNLKGPGIANVFMHTSTTPANGNPNPPLGYIIVQLEDNYSLAIAGSTSITSPSTGSASATVAANSVYILVSPGTATAAQMQAFGLTPGITPVVGAAFVASQSGTLPGSATAIGTGVSNITNIEAVGDPNATIAPAGTPGLGAVQILQCLKNGTIQQPADNTVIGLQIRMNNSSVSGGNPSPGN